MPFQFSTKVLPKQAFINNEYASADSSLKALSVFNPVDGSLVADDIPIANEAQVDKAVAAAEKAFVKWRSIPGAERRAIMTKFADLLEQHTEVLADLTRLTLGAPKATFGKFEVGLCAEVRCKIPQLIFYHIYQFPSI